MLEKSKRVDKPLKPSLNYLMQIFGAKLCLPHLSLDMVTNLEPSLLTSSECATALALASAYRSVSSLKRKDTTSSPGDL